MLLESMILIVLAAFVFAYIDVTVGTGYGTILTPALLFFGFTPLEVVPAVIASGIIAGILAGVLHNYAGNVNFGRGKGHFRIMSVLAAFGTLGAILAVILAVHLPPHIVEAYIGVVVLLVGLTLLATPKKTFSFSWPKIIALGVFAAFNKGISAAGYGSIVTGGQILSGVNPKRAVAITAVAEAFISLVAIGVYLAAMQHVIDWTLTGLLALGTLPAVPLAVLSVKKLDAGRLRFMIGAITFAVGLLFLLELFFL